ncbi:DUF5304 family protein [Streptomyces sp. 7-21]|uniref:DUF5304 family protein n=1 Tax=Streptomyces sp. 7-21 TaxID=2802283 RepID=UPI00191E5764|nr:DUF5304 family protein [Streptomyces sp. 7-21]MBL1066740.1 DUF5304 family protein [Streptomyces sp. 7-21]
MTDATPPHDTGPDPDSWAAACEEDLAAERARRRERYGPPPLDPVTELRRLADAVTERLGKAGAGLGLDVALLAGQARSALEPVLERNADVLRHLAGAGRELAAAYRAAVLAHEGRWTRGQQPPGGERQPADPPEAADGPGGPEPGGKPRDDGGGAGGSGGPQRIDLD